MFYWAFANMALRSAMRDRASMDKDMERMKLRCISIVAFSSVTSFLCFLTLIPDVSTSHLVFRVWFGTLTIVVYSGIYTVVSVVGHIVRALEASTANGAASTGGDKTAAALEKFKTFRKKTLVTMLAGPVTVLLFSSDWGQQQAPYVLPVLCSVIMIVSLSTAKLLSTGNKKVDAHGKSTLASDGASSSNAADSTNNSHGSQAPASRIASRQTKPLK
jgi:hypothetical protein